MSSTSSCQVCSLVTVLTEVSWCLIAQNASFPILNPQDPQQVETLSGKSIFCRIQKKTLQKYLVTSTLPLHMSPLNVKAAEQIFLKFSIEGCY